MLRPEPRQQGNSFGFSAWRGSSADMAYPHAHNDLEINYCDGELHYWTGGKTFTVPPGTLCAFWGAKPHQLINFNVSSTLAFVTVPLIQFMGWNVPESMKVRLLQGEVLLAAPPWTAAVVEEKFDVWASDTYRGTERARRATSMEVEALLQRLSSAPSLPAAHTTDSIGYSIGNRLHRAARMATFIAENYEKDIKVTDVAGAIHLHSNRAGDIFRDVFGIGIRRYLSQYRVSEVQKRLLTTSLSVADAGRQSGFASTSSLHQTFVEICGVTPAKWKSLHS